MRDADVVELLSDIFAFELFKLFEQPFLILGGDAREEFGNLL